MTYDEARDIINTVFLNAWGATNFPVVWRDVPGSVPTSETPWARVTLRHATGRQASLAGESGAQRWERTGTVFVQIFSPIGDGSKKGYELAQLVTNAYQSARGSDVWFRNVRINELGSDGAFESFNVLADFSYDDVR